MLTLQVKYGICSIRNTIAASGAMGSRVAADVTYNSFINTKGESPKVTEKNSYLQARRAPTSTVTSTTNTPTGT